MLINFLVGLLALAVFLLLLYVIIRAAVISALRVEGAKLAHANQLLGVQTELTARLAKHLIAQSDLMLAQARHQGMTDDELAPVVAQLAERKAEPEPPGFALPFR
jgi:hypothetical protein